jgi:hypothetical protein
VVITEEAKYYLLKDSQSDDSPQAMRDSLVYLLLLYARCSTKAARILGFFPHVFLCICSE